MFPRLRGALIIATIHARLLWVDIVTSYRPRTDVERWQIQDRLRLRLVHAGCRAVPRFYEAGGRLAFRLRLGWRPDPALLRTLESIDAPEAARGA